MAKKTYHNLGSMKLKKDKDANGNAQYYIEVDKKIADRIKIDGKPLSKNKDGKVFISVERPTDKFDRMLAAKAIDVKEYEEKVGQFEADGKLSFIKFDLQATTDE